MKKKIQLKGYRFKLFPTSEQATLIDQFLGNNRYVWNFFLDMNIRNYKLNGKFVFYQDTSYILTILKQEYDTHWLSISPSQCLQQTLMDLDKAMKTFCKERKTRNVGFPKFKKKGQYSSIRFPQHFEVAENWSSIKLPKLGQVKWLISKKVEGKIKQVTVYKELDNYYCSLSVEEVVAHKPKTGREVGIDLGVKYLATNSRGQHKESINKLPNIIDIETHIKRKQQELSRKVKGSNSWKKVKEIIQKLYRKLANIRLDYLHKTTTKLVINNDLIAVENLKPKNMSGSAKGTEDNPGKNVNAKAKLNHNILGNSWGTFTKFLEYKSEWYGKTFIKVDPKFTSQTCSNCGYCHKSNRRSQSVFKCRQCKFKLNADHNAAINILHKGQKLFIEQSKSSRRKAA